MSKAEEVKKICAELVELRKWEQELNEKLERIVGGESVTVEARLTGTSAAAKPEQAAPRKRRRRSPLKGTHTQSSAYMMILREMEKNPSKSYSIQQLADKTGKPYWTVSGPLTTLIRDGKIMRIDRGRYQLTQKQG